MVNRSTARWIPCLITVALIILLPVGSGAEITTNSDRLPRQAVVEGRITDLLTGEGVAEVQVRAGDVNVTSDVDGDYRLELSPGLYDVAFSAKGYIGLTQTGYSVALDVSVPLNVKMTSDQSSPELDRLLYSMLPEIAQELPQSASGYDSARGYGLSVVTEIPETIRVLMPDGNVTVMLMDEYLKGVLPQEVPHSWPMEALKAQAIAARSYASTRHAHGDVGADVCTTQHCQVWSSIHYDTTDRAVEETHGIVASYDERIISAFFFSHCDGHTRNSEDVWSTPLAYCRAVACPCGYDEMFGHGVGMCQWGAYAMAQQGATFDDIVRHYYSGVELTLPAEPALDDALVTPRNGSSSDTLVFSARYVHPLGDAPAVAEVEIDGHALGLVQDATDPAVYVAHTQLESGEHEYAFHFGDGKGHIARWPEVGVAALTVSSVAPTLPAPTPLPQGTGNADICALAWSTSADWEAGSHTGGAIISQGNGALIVAEEATTAEFVASASPASVGSFVALAGGFAGEWPQGAAVELSVRVGDGLEWNDWTLLPALERDVARTGLYLTEPIFVAGQQAQIRLRMVRAGGGSSPVIDSLRLYAISADDEPSIPNGLAGDWVTRAEWGADEAIMRWAPDYEAPQIAVVHPLSSGSNISPEQAMRALYGYHCLVREWGDLGYHCLVDRHGRVYEGRAGGEHVVGRHAGRYDHGSMGLAMLIDADDDMSLDSLDGASTVLADACQANLIDPQGVVTLLDAELPAIATRAQVLGEANDPLIAHMPALRQSTLNKMADLPPKLNLRWPQAGQQVSGVLEPVMEASAVVTRVEGLIDDELVYTSDGGSFAWRWNTLEASEQTHNLRIVAHNAAGQVSVGADVLVDNTSPSGLANAPTWSMSPDVRIALTSDADWVQLSSGWWWEGESLYHSANSGKIVQDPEARNGQAWLGRAGIDVPGGWFGPYTCALASWRSYDVLFRVKTNDRQQSYGLATLDVVDNKGQRVYVERPMAANQLAADDVYEDIVLALDYESQWPTCDSMDDGDGLEFRTWFSALGDLYLDRVTVFAQRVPMEPEIVWSLPYEQGQHAVRVRFSDDAGNAVEEEMIIGVDWTAPVWSDYGLGRVTVHDMLSGLDADSARYAVSFDSGFTWGDWQALDMAIDDGSNEAVELVIPVQGPGLVRIRVLDVCGNEAFSEPIAWSEPTSTPLPIQLTLPLLVLGG